MRRFRWRALVIRNQCLNSAALAPAISCPIVDMNYFLRTSGAAVERFRGALAAGARGPAICRGRTLNFFARCSRSSWARLRAVALLSVFRFFGATPASSRPEHRSDLFYYCKITGRLVKS